ncbi:MAG: hypothetical protein HYZ37_08290 [Candidatus Solibacter usitatus]|nr:hypothetical protein [Candidatus Solibacter usitatus]
MNRAAIAFAAFLCAAAALPQTAQKQTAKKGGFQLPNVQASPEEKHKLEARTAELEAAVAALKGNSISEDLIADVAVYAKAGRWRLEFPGFFDQKDIDDTIKVVEQGLERARQLRGGASPWVAQKGRKIFAYVSPLDGSVQPYGVTVPDSYDGSKPVRLYVWIHGRNARLTEASFISGIATPPGPTSTAWTADVGQITIDCYGRGNNANHWPGEVDVFEAIAAVKRRYKIDDKRVILRGFSLGGAAAWHLALHHPDRFVAAETGAGTWPRRSLMGGFPPHQTAVLRIWENIMEWALNSFNLPIAGHDGDNDTQVASIPPPAPGTPTRGQLESSIRVREQLAKEGFPYEGEPNHYLAKGTNSIFLISENTGHAVSAAVRKKLDAFLKEWGDRGQVSPDQVRFLTYTTRYNRSYWVSLDALEKHYERAEVDAKRDANRKEYNITTKNISRVTIRETDRMARLRIDGQTLRVKPSREIVLEKSGSVWKAAGKFAGMRKTHGLQGPIDDAFLDPYLLVRPTGTPWNEAANKEALSILERFDRAYARNYRAHPRVKDDKDVTAEDFARYNVALFGDPGSNHWIAKILSKLPLRWTRDEVTFGKSSYPAASHLPLMTYPNPLHPTRYVVLNSGLTISEREYNSDYSMPRFGDFAIVKTGSTGETESVIAGLFDESWKLPADVR